MLNVSHETSFLIDYYDKKSKLNILNKKSNELENLQKHIYDKLDNIYNFLNKDLCNINNFRKIYNNDERKYWKFVRNAYKKHFTDNLYIDITIKEFIHNTPGRLVVYKLPYKNRIIKINFIEYSKISESYLSNLDEIVKNMLVQIYLLSHLGTNRRRCNEGIYVIIFMTPYKRKLEKKLGVKFKGEIIVYRKEEFFKVFSHELIHNFGVDTHMWEFIAAAKVNNSKEYKIFYKFLENCNLNRENDVVRQEALVEFWWHFFKHYYMSI
jgi:hypothetical protein